MSLYKFLGGAAIVVGTALATWFTKSKFDEGEAHKNREKGREEGKAAGEKIAREKYQSYFDFSIFYLKSLTKIFLRYIYTSSYTNVFCR